MTAFVDIYNTIIDLLTYIDTYLTETIYDFVVKCYAEFIKWYILAYIKTKIYLLHFSWDIAKEILASLNISSFITTYFNAINSDVLKFLTFIRIPDAINILINAYVTKLVFKFLGF